MLHTCDDPPLPQREEPGLASFADLVFHVLAHVEASAGLAASLFDACYIQFAAAELGPMHGRQLGTDSELLGRLLATHSLLARTQQLAWLHDSIAEFVATERLSLAELTRADVARPDLLATLLADDRDRVEVLRCAVALERPHYERLSRAPGARRELSRALAGLHRVAPLLSRAKVECVRALRLRGRAYGRLIWVGLPESEVGPSVEHAALQAAHEASLVELVEAAAGARLGFTERELERAALELLAARCRRAGLETLHRGWFDALALPADWRALASASGGAALAPHLGELVRRRLAAPGAG